MITDRETNAIYFSEVLMSNTKYSKAAGNIQKALESLGVIPIYLENTNDIWARDYMPIQISESRFIEFRYDPDYLQGDWDGRRNYKTYPDMVCDKLGIQTIKTDLIIDGGNIVKNSNCIILTEKVLIENRHSPEKKDLIKKLEKTFEVDKVVLIPWDISEIYGHSDGVLRFIDNETLLVSQEYKKDSLISYRLKQAGFKLEFLNFETKWSNKLNWSYINFLQTKDLILIPRLRAEEDDQAYRQISDYYSDYAVNKRILQIDMNEIIELGGALNCISWTIKG